MVRAGGVEPPRAYTHCHLKTARLPFRHARRQSISLHPECEVNKSACRGLWSNVLALVDVLWSLGVRGVQPAGEADARPGGLRARPWDVRRACAGLRRERGRETASVCGWPPLGISEADFGQAASMCAWDGPIRAVSRRSCGKVSACVEVVPTTIPTPSSRSRVSACVGGDPQTGRNDPIGAVVAERGYEIAAKRAEIYPLTDHNLPDMRLSPGWGRRKGVYRNPRPPDSAKNRQNRRDRRPIVPIVPEMGNERRRLTRGIRWRRTGPRSRRGTRRNIRRRSMREYRQATSRRNARCES